MTPVDPETTPTTVPPVRHLTPAELEAGMSHVLASPSDHGTVALIVRRPAENEREVLDRAELSSEQGLVGDNWITRAGPGATPSPDTQLNVMNARVAALVARSPERRPLAGDQLYLDLDISEDNLPAGTRLAIGDTVIEVSAKPHTGCSKFSSRFGQDALRWANSSEGRRLRLRGLNARVVHGGAIHVGDTVRKV